MGRKPGTAVPSSQKRRLRVVRKPRGKKDSDKDEVEDDDVNNDEVVELKKIRDCSHVLPCESCEDSGEKCSHMDNLRSCWVGNGGVNVYNDAGTRTGIIYDKHAYFFSK